MIGQPTLQTRLYKPVETYTDGWWDTPVPRRALTQRELAIVASLDPIMTEDARVTTEAPRKRIHEAEELLDGLCESPTLDPDTKKTITKASAAIDEAIFGVEGLESSMYSCISDAIRQAFVSGQRDGFRLGVSLQSHLQAAAPGAKFAGTDLTDDQGFLLLAGALTNDHHADVLLGYLVHSGPPTVPPKLAASVAALNLPLTVEGGEAE